MNLTPLGKAAGAAATLLLVTACSSSGSKPAGTGIGAPVPPASGTAAVKTTDLGKPITAGSLSITVSGPAKTRGNGGGLEVTFAVSMTNTGSAGDVKGPGSFQISCNGDTGDFMSTTPAARKTVPAGQTVTGTAVVSWLKWNAVTQCKAPTTVDAVFSGAGSGTLSWSLPADQLAAVNLAAAGAAASPSS